MDRRLLERLAVGVPIPSRPRRKHAPARRLGHLRRVGAPRVRIGDGAELPEPGAPTVLDRVAALFESPPPPPSPTPEPEQPTPEPAPVAVVALAPRPPAPAPGALVLLFVERELRGASSAEEAAVAYAEELAADREVVVVDLDLDRPGLERRLGPPDPEGLAGALYFGASLRSAIRPVEGRRFSALPAGTVPDPAGLLGHPRWAQLVREAARRGITLLAHLRPDAPGVERLAELAAGAVLVARPDRELELRDELPARLPVERIVAPHSPPPPDEERAAVDRARAALAALLRSHDEPAPPPPARPALPEPVDGPDPGRSPQPDSFAASLSGWLRAEEARLESGGRSLETLEPIAMDEMRNAVAATAPLPASPPGADEPLVARAGDPGEPMLAPARPSGPPPTKYIVPRVGPRWELFIRLSAIAILAYWTYYIGWRWTSTLNLDALWFSIPLVLAETWGLLTAYFLVFTAWRLNHRTPPAAPPGLAVDVFITTYDEPLEIIRRTAIAARAIHYPHETYVLDDGRRDEVRSMAEEIGVRYLRRENNEHAKAGNLNHALKHASGDFLLQLDADHAPLPQFLHQVLGFFADPRVAFVQTPQDFYNTDSFTSDLNEAEHRLWEEQKLFFAVIQPGKDRTNSAFFCGSCAVIRRAALDEIGGFSTQSITEDIETSLLLHARGWKSVYHGESLAYGLAAGSAEAFHTQHRRWARGAMQVLRKMNPIGWPGLSPAQRIGYFYSLTAYVIGLQKLIFYSAPIIFFLTGVLPIRAVDREFLVRFVPYLLVSVALAEMLARGLGFTWLVERYQMAKFWTYSRALPTYFTTRRLRFRVTPKGPARVPLATYLPQLLLMIATVFAVNWATLAYTYGWVDYEAPGWRSLAFQVNFLWSLLNFVLAAYVVRLSIRIQQHRQDHRFADRFPIHVRVRDERGLADPEIALTVDLNANGLRFRSVVRFESGSRLQLTLPLSTGEVTTDAVVVHVGPDPEPDVPIFIHGVEFHEIPLDVRDAIELHCAHHSVPIDQLRYQSQTGMLTRAQDWVRNARGEPRRRVHLPAWVRVGEHTAAGRPAAQVAFLEEVSRSGARLIMDQPVAPGSRIAFEVPGTALRGEGRAIFSRALETPIGVRFAVGVRREPLRDHDSRTDKKMRIPRLWRAAGIATLLVAGLGGAASPVSAQLELAVFGSGEVDTEDFSMVLIGASVSPGGLGLKPVGTLLAYKLNFPEGEGQASVTALNPQVGLRYQWMPGAVQASVGYLFLDAEEEVLPGVVPGGGESGITGTLQGDYWGSGLRTAQAIGTYNFSDHYAWARGRFAQQLLTMGESPIRIGAEVVGQGSDVFEMEDSGVAAEAALYRAVQAGLLAEYQLNPSFRLTGVAGAKSDNVAGNADLIPYFKLEFLLLP